MLHTCYSRHRNTANQSAALVRRAYGVRVFARDEQLRVKEDDLWQA